VVHLFGNAEKYTGIKWSMAIHRRRICAVVASEDTKPTSNSIRTPPSKVLVKAINRSDYGRSQFGRLIPVMVLLIDASDFDASLIKRKGIYCSRNRTLRRIILKATYKARGGNGLECFGPGTDPVQLARKPI